LPGYYTRRETIELEAGKTKTVDLTLGRTRQRLVSYGLLSVAGAGFIGAGIQGAVALQKQSTAQNILQQTQSGNITVSNLEEYNDSVSTWETLRNSTAITFVAASILGITGAMAYAIEPQRNSDSTPRNNVSVSLTLGPSNAGIEINGRF
jgi:hypothetical protein